MSNLYDRSLHWLVVICSFLGLSMAYYPSWSLGRVGAREHESGVTF